MRKKYYKLFGKSMIPVLREGMLLIVNNDTSLIKPGDIICFYRKETNKMVTHRLYFSINTPFGEKCIECGDNRLKPTIIPKQCVKSQVVGIYDEKSNKIHGSKNLKLRNKPIKSILLNFCIFADNLLLSIKEIKFFLSTKVL